MPYGRHISGVLLAGLVVSGVVACQAEAPKAAPAVISSPLSDLPSPEPREVDRIPLPPLDAPQEPQAPLTEEPATPPPDESAPVEVTPPEDPPAETPPVEEPPATDDPPVAETPEEPAPDATPDPQPPPDVTPRPTPAPEDSTPSDAEIRDDYLRRFNAKVERHKRYPKQARRMGRQGRVVMLIQLDATGELINLQIVQSSGHLALDTAATQAVKDAAPFPPPPHPAFDAAPTFQMGLSFELR